MQEDVNPCPMCGSKDTKTQTTKGYCRDCGFTQPRSVFVRLSDAMALLSSVEYLQTRGVYLTAMYLERRWDVKIDTHSASASSLAAALIALAGENKE